jgi:hypothetical protein
MKKILLAALLSLSVLADTAPPIEGGVAKWPFGQKFSLAPFVALTASTAPSFVSGAEVGPLIGMSGAYFLSERFGIWTALHLNPRRYSSNVGTANSALFIELPVGVAVRSEGDLFSKTSVNFFKFGLSLAIPTGNFTGNMITAVSMVSKPYLSIAMEASTLYPLSDSLAFGPIIIVKYGLTQPIDSPTPNLRPFDLSAGAQLAF